MTESDEIRIDDNAAESRYELHVGPGLAATTTYHLQPGLITLLHTEVEPRFEGRDRLSARRRRAGRGRERELAVLPICPFVRAYIARHPQDGLRLRG